MIPVQSLPRTFRAWVSAALVSMLAMLPGCGEDTSVLSDPLRGRDAAKRMGAAYLTELFDRACRLDYRLEEGAAADFRSDYMGWDAMLRSESPTPHWRCDYTVTIKYKTNEVGRVGVGMLVGIDGAVRMAPYGTPRGNGVGSAFVANHRIEQEFFEMLEARASRSAVLERDPGAGSLPRGEGVSEPPRRVWGVDVAQEVDPEAAVEYLGVRFKKRIAERQLWKGPYNGLTAARVPEDMRVRWANRMAEVVVRLDESGIAELDLSSSLLSEKRDSGAVKLSLRTAREAVDACALLAGKKADGARLRTFAGRGWIEPEGEDDVGLDLQFLCEVNWPAEGTKGNVLYIAMTIGKRSQPCHTARVRIVVDDVLLFDSRGTMMGPADDIGRVFTEGCASARGLATQMREWRRQHAPTQEWGRCDPMGSREYEKMFRGYSDMFQLLCLHRYVALDASGVDAELPWPESLRSEITFGGR